MNLPESPFSRAACGPRTATVAAGTALAKARRGAFTLLELLLVICILGVLLAVSLPRAAGVHGRMQLRELGKTLGAQLRFCQEYAAAKSTPMRMTYLPAQRRFRVQAAADAAGMQFEDLVTPWDGVLAMPPNVQVQGFEATYADGRKEMEQVSFDAYGPAPTVAWSLQGEQERVSVRYAGSTRMTVVEE